ncbi:unnamed protein product, partial [Ectocarpus sp. 12 AP-2014]
PSFAAFLLPVWSRLVLPENVSKGVQAGVQNKGDNVLQRQQARRRTPATPARGTCSHAGYTQPRAIAPLAPNTIGLQPQRARARSIQRSSPPPYGTLADSASKNMFVTNATAAP